MDNDKSQSAACPVRVVNIYATPWTFTGTLGKDEGAPANLGDLKERYELYKVQLPRLLWPRVSGAHILGDCVTLADDVDGVTIDEAKTELFMLPSKRIVLAITMCLRDGALGDERRAEPIAEVLEQCINGKIKIAGQLVTEALPAKLSDDAELSRDAIGAPLLPERHQLVFVTRPPGGYQVPDQQVINKILWRKAPPYRPEFVDPRLPKQLNSHVEAAKEGASPAERLRELLRVLRPETGQESPHEPPVQSPRLGVVTPYVSLLYGHQKYVETSIFLSTVHAVGTAARFRSIWREAYELVLEFREEKLKPETGQQTRDDLEHLADHLGNLEFDLTFSVEFPLLRIETFQTELYEAMDLAAQAKSLSQMFVQLDGSLSSEITAIEARERRRADDRQRWNSFAAGLLSLIAVPVGFVIAFLGINATNVNQKDSMWNEHYSGVYIIASSLALITVFFILYPYLKDFSQTLRNSQMLRSGWTYVVFGIAISLAADLPDWPTTFLRLASYFFTALGGFVVLIGLSLIGWWWKTRREPTDNENPAAPEVANADA